MSARPNIERALARRFSPMARFRIAREMKQCEVAACTLIHETTVSKIERGVRRATPQQEKRIAKALRTTPKKVHALLFESRWWAGIGALRKSGRA